MIFSTAAQVNLLGLGAAAVWGAADFAGGFVTRRTSPAIVVAIAHGLSLIVILAVLLLAGIPIPSEQTAVYGLISGVAGGIGLMLFYEGLATGAMGLTSALTGVITAILPVVYSYFHRGHPSPAQFAGFVIAVIAIWMIAYTSGGKLTPRGFGLAVSAGIGFGLLLIFLDKAGVQSVGWALAFSRIASASIAITLSIFILIRRKRRAISILARTRSDAADSAGLSQSALKTFSTRILPLAALAGTFDTAGNVLYTLSAVHGRLDVAAVLSSLYPGFTILLAAWLLRERTTRTQALGMAFALVAVVLISF